MNDNELSYESDIEKLRKQGHSCMDCYNPDRFGWCTPWMPTHRGICNSWKGELNEQ